MRSWHPQKNKKVAEFSNPAFEKKGWIIPHEKCLFLLSMDFLVKEIMNHFT
jgi:hypothetical protein